MIFVHFLWFWRCKKCVFDWQGRQNMHCREKSEILSRGSLGTPFSLIFESNLEAKSWKMASGKVPKKTSIFEEPFFRFLKDFYIFWSIFNFMIEAFFLQIRIQMGSKSHLRLFFGFLMIFCTFLLIFDHFWYIFWLLFGWFFLLIWCFFGVFQP